MVDFSDLAKLYRTAQFAQNTRTSPEWWAADQPQTPSYNHYSRDFLVGYLLHYCRLCDQANREGSLPVLQALSEIEPDNGEIHYLMGRQYELAGSLPEALAAYERAAAQRPDLPDYMLAAVSVACLLGERNRGLAMVCNVISANPVLAKAYYERGLIFEADENWGRALRDYEMCSRLEPQNPLYFTAMAGMYRQQKLYKMARRCAVKALKLDPNFTAAHEELRQLPLFEQFVDFLRPGDHDNRSGDGSGSSRDEDYTGTYR